MFRLKMPIEPLDAADQICSAVRAGQAEYAQRLEELPHPDPIEDGRMAVLDAEQQANALRVSRKAMIDDAVAAIKGLAESYALDLAHQTMPRGDEIDNPDYVLLRDELITSAEQLQVLAERYAENYTMSIMISRYAEGREWPGFENITNFEPLTSFGMARFELCTRACHAPDGPSMIQQADPGELERMADAYGVLDELRAAINGRVA